MTTGESCAHGVFPAQLLSEGSLLALGDSGHGVLLSPPSLYPLEYRASCSRQQRLCHRALGPHPAPHGVPVSLLAGGQVCAPPPLSCGEQQGSATPASDRFPRVIISDTQRSLASGKGGCPVSWGSQSKQVLSASKTLGHCQLPCALLGDPSHVPQILARFLGENSSFSSLFC